MWETVLQSLQDTLLSIISTAMALCDEQTPADFDDLLADLDLFTIDCQHNFPLLQHHSRNSSAWRLDVLQNHLERAVLDAREIFNRDLIRLTVWDAFKAQNKLQALHERVMTSFQVFAAFDVGISNAANKESKVVVGTAELDTVEVVAAEMDSVEMGMEEVSHAVSKESKVVTAEIGTREILHGEVLTLSDCYPFYYFEMEVVILPQNSSCSEIQDDQIADVAIGFCNSTKSMNDKVCNPKQRTTVGKFSGSCWYEMRQGEIFYHNQRRTSIEVLRVGNVKEDRPVYRVGAGIHPSSRNVFFTMSGQVVGVVPANIMDFPIPFVLLPRKSPGSVQVTLQFPPNGSFLEEPLPSRFDRASFYRGCLHVSSSGLNFSSTALLISKRPPISQAAILADVPIPMRTTIFYFAIEVEKERDEKADIAIGFASTDTFRNDQLPGFYRNSCAYHSQGMTANVVQNCIVEQKGSRRGMQAAVSSKCTKIHIGAGVHHGTNEFFFVREGVFMGTVGNGLTGVIKPVVAVSGYCKIKWRFPSLLKTHECIDLRLVNSACHRSSTNSSVFYMNSLQDAGHEVYHKGVMSDIYKREIKEFAGVASFRTFSVAPLGSTKCYYFELTVYNMKEPPSCIAIGFSHHSLREDDKLPGCYPLSIGYHNDSGKLFHSGYACEKFGPAFCEGDIVGAGINHDNNTIFFTKNGKLVGCRPNNISCALFPIVGLGSVGAKARLNSGKSPFSYKDLPSNSRELLIYFPQRGWGGAPLLSPLSSTCADFNTI